MPGTVSSFSLQSIQSQILCYSNRKWTNARGQIPNILAVRRHKKEVKFTFVRTHVINNHPKVKEAFIGHFQHTDLLLNTSL
jgi:hypothetical protein